MVNTRSTWYGHPCVDAATHRMTGTTTGTAVGASASANGGAISKRFWTTSDHALMDYDATDERPTALTALTTTEITNPATSDGLPIPNRCGTVPDGRSSCGATTSPPRVPPMDEPEADKTARIAAAILIRDMLSATIVRTERRYGDAG